MRAASRAASERGRGKVLTPRVWSDRACRDLVVAVLDLAIEDLRGRHGREEADAAHAWIFESAAEPETAGTFGWYCRLLGFDPPRARAFIERRLRVQGYLQRRWRSAHE